MTGSAHLTIQVDLGDAPILRGAIIRRIEQLEVYLAKANEDSTVDSTELLLTRDIVASLRRSLAAIDEQLPAKVAA